MSLTEFLLARITEDEATAEGCLKDYPPDEPYGLEYQHDHQMRWYPARVLAECEAKRRIVALHEPGGGAWCTSACEGESPAGCDTLRALALPYAEHPDFDPAWKVEA